MRITGHPISLEYGGHSLKQDITSDLVGVYCTVKHGYKIKLSTSDLSTSDVSEIELETSGSADDTETGSSVVSLLSVLCQPIPSQLARKRKILRNPVHLTGVKMTLRMSSQTVRQRSFSSFCWKVVLLCLQERSFHQEEHHRQTHHLDQAPER